MRNFIPHRIAALILLSFTCLFGLKAALYFLQSIADDQSGLVYEQKLDSFLPILPWIERNDYDAHLRFYRPGPIAKDKVAIVEINERSLQKLGQFPFSRSIYARFLERVESAGAKSVAFDIVFAEPERNSALEELRSIRNQLQKMGAHAGLSAIDARIQSLDSDDALVRAIRSAKIPIVAGFTFAGAQAVKDRAAQISDEIAKRLGAYSLPSEQVNQNTFAYDKTMDIPVLPHADLLVAPRSPSTLGFFTASADPDSVIRKTPMVMNFKGGFYGSLALMAVAQYYGLDPTNREAAPKIVMDAGYRIRDATGKINVPINSDASILVGFYGEERSFDYYEFADILEGKDLDQLKGKIIFLGVTAVGEKDIRATPFSSDYPGVEVHATIASNILTGFYLVKDYRYHLTGLFLLLVVGGALAWVSFNSHPLHSFLINLGAIFLLQYGSQKLAFDRGLVLPTFLPSLEYLVLLFSGILNRYFSQENEKKYIRDALSRYVSGPVVNEILKNRDKLRLGGEKKTLTVMFCDMVGFTKLSEHMDAVTLTQLLNQFFTRMTEVIQRNQGTLDKYMGDAIMCFWGAPLDQPKHAELACATAIEMLRELEKINREWLAKHGFSIGVRIGINSGEMAVGNMGSDQVFSYTVMGDNVNLGSRLEGVNNNYGTTILVTENTHRAAKEKFTFRHLDKVQVKGKEDAVEIYELIGTQEISKPEWLQQFELGLDHYRHGQWEESESAFTACLKLNSADAPAKIFIERLKELKLKKPDSWDGIWKFTAK